MADAPQTGYVVSARKYRPQDFASVVGQGHVTETLRVALAKDQLAHAYLFCGPRGVGKTTCARILAHAVNQPEGLDTAAGDPELNIYELDAASNNSVEDVRKLIEQVRFLPQPVGTKDGKSVPGKTVFIIDEVHMLSTAAFNAFLKTLEEPPAHAMFILATTEKHKILPTILSRCQKFDFKRISVADTVAHLQRIAEQEGFTVDTDALHLVAQKADGALRDALSIFDQLVAAGQGTLTLDLVRENLSVLDHAVYLDLAEHLLNQAHGPALLQLEDVLKRGFEPAAYLSGLLAFFRDLLVAQVPQTLSLLDHPPALAQALEECAQKFSPELLLNAFQLVSETEQNLRNSAAPRLHVELLLVKLAHLQQALDTAALANSGPMPEKKKSLAVA